MKVVTAAAMRELEAKADGLGLSSAALMQLAGLAVAEEVARSVGGARGRRALILVGPGNNGGDGLVTAACLHDWGAEVTLYLVNRKLDGDKNIALCRLRGIESFEVGADSGLERLTALLRCADVVVDALLGIGLGRPIVGSLKEVLETVESARRKRPLVGDQGSGVRCQETGDGGPAPDRRPPSPIWPATPDPRPLFVALDIPTGLNSDTGEADPVCFAADLTVTLGFPKVGMFLFPGAEKVGQLVTRSVGIAAQLAADIPTTLLSADYVRHLLPLRPPAAHKGAFGKVLVVGGSANYVGAPSLAAMAAMRAGAGLVTLATGSSLQPAVAAKLTETTFLPLPEVEGGALGLAATRAVEEALGDYNALVIGCGLGRHPETVEFVCSTLRSCPRRVKVVVDADGLNALSEKERWWEEMAIPLVLTPHPGEMARLTGRSVGEVNARRIDIAREASAKWGKVVVLKGAYTVVAEPGGEAYINPSANPALAAAGVGDVLSGIIAGFMAQGLDSLSSAIAGVYVHGETGETLRRERGDAGLLASELAAAVPRTLKHMRDIR